MKNIAVLSLMTLPFLAYAMEVETPGQALANPILQEPRVSLFTDQEFAIKVDLHEVIRTEWYRELNKNSDWWKALIYSNNFTTILCDGVREIQFDTSCERIRVLGSTSKPEQQKLYTLDGRLIDGADFSTERCPYELSEHELEAQGLSASTDGIWYAKLIAKQRKIIGMKYGAVAVVHDYEPGYRFEKYLAKRAPLAQILLLEAIRSAHEKGEKITLTAQEKEILNGMPPQFEKAKEFLKKSVK